MIVEDNERNLKLLRDVLGATATARSRLVRAGAMALVRSAARYSSSWISSCREWTASRLSRAATLRRARGTPIVAVTAFVMKEDRDRFLAAGFDGYLEKPVDIRALRSCRLLPRTGGPGAQS